MSMLVIALSDCPPKVRGDLSKWLFELNTGVYVGKLSARVREELWSRICENLPNGKATMVYSAANEQGMEFRVHNTTWQPTDFDGLTLMRRPFPKSDGESVRAGVGTSNAAHFLRSRRIQTARQQRQEAQGYVVVDVETTGRNPKQDEMIELGAVYISDHQIRDRFSVLLKTEREIPVAVQKLTGITPEMLLRDGREPEQAVRDFREWIADHMLVFHNAGFDRAFLSRAFARYDLPGLGNRYRDTLTMAKQKLDDVDNYRLETIARYYGNMEPQTHRALEDCMLTWFIYEKLKQSEGS